MKNENKERIIVDLSGSLENFYYEYKEDLNQKERLDIINMINMLDNKIGIKKENK